MKFQTMLNSDTALLIDKGFGGRFSVFVNGEKLQKKNGHYVVLMDEEPKVLTVKNHPFLGTVPVVTLDGEKVVVGKELKGYELAISALPILMVFFGGALGGIFGVAGMAGSVQVFRTKLPQAVKILLSLVISALAVLLYFIIGSTIYVMLTGGV